MATESPLDRAVAEYRVAVANCLRLGNPEHALEKARAAGRLIGTLRVELNVDLKAEIDVALWSRGRLVIEIEETGFPNGTDHLQDFADHHGAKFFVQGNSLNDSIAYVFWFDE